MIKTGTSKTGIVDSIIVHPSHGYNRDEIKKQHGHRMIVNFKQRIAGDSIEYHTDNKSDGYNIINGKKNKKLGSLEILKGGRGKSAKKARDLRGEQTYTNETN